MEIGRESSVQIMDEGNGKREGKERKIEIGRESSAQIMDEGNGKIEREERKKNEKKKQHWQRSCAKKGSN